MSLRSGRRPTASLKRGTYSMSPVASRTKNAAACTQCTVRSVTVNRFTITCSVGMAHPRVRVVAALLPVAGLDGRAELDALDPLDALVAVHVRDHDADGRAVLALQRLAVHLVGEHHVAELRLVARERVDVG